MSAAGIIISITQTRKVGIIIIMFSAGHKISLCLSLIKNQNQKKLQSTVQGSDIIDVCRGNGTFETIRTEDLVPGDVIIIPASGCILVIKRN